MRWSQLWVKRIVVLVLLFENWLLVRIKDRVIEVDGVVLYDWGFSLIAVTDSEASLLLEVGNVCSAIAMLPKLRGLFQKLLCFTLATLALPLAFVSTGTMILNKMFGQFTGCLADLIVLFAHIQNHD